MSLDREQLLAEAQEQAAAASRLLGNPALQSSHRRLVEHYIDQWRSSDPDTAAGAVQRDAAFFMLRALDALLADIRAVAVGGAIAQHNMGAVPRSNGRI